MTEDPKKNERASKDQGPMGSKKGGPQQAPLAGKGSAPATPPPATPPPAAPPPAAQPPKPAPPQTPKPEAPKLETPKLETPKLETPMKPEPPQKPGPAALGAEPGKPAPASASAPGAPEAQKLRPDSARPEAGRPESPRPGAEGTPAEGAQRPAEGKPPPPPSPPEPERRHGCLWLLALLAVLVVAGIVTWPYWSPRVTPFVADHLPGRPGDEPPADQSAQPEGEVARPADQPAPPADQPARPEGEVARPAEEPTGEQPAGEQIANLETRIAQLEETVRQAAMQQEDLATLRQETEALRAQVATLSGRLQDVGAGEFAVMPEQIDQRLNALASEREQLAQQVSSLNEQVTKLNEQVTNLNGQVTGLDEQTRNLSQEIETGRGAAAVALGLSRLSETIGTSRAYREELDAVKNIAGQAVLDEETLQPLEANAATGVPTFTDLYRRFPEMADAVVQADGKRDDEGLLQTAINRLRSLVSVRPTGEAALEKGGVAAALERARLRLEVGDLAGAIDALGNLEGAAASAAGWWLDSARSRLAVQRAMERMQIRALSTLSSREG